MTYTLSWLEPGRVISLVMPAVTTDDLLFKLDAEVNAMLDTASQPVHMLIDARDLKTNPSAQATMKMNYYKHPQLGHLVVLGLLGNPFLRFLAAMIGKTIGLQIKPLSTMEEAHAYLASI